MHYVAEPRQRPKLFSFIPADGDLFAACESTFTLPTTENEWRNIADDFEKRCNFPNCLGAVDGKHVNIKPPTGSGSYFYNYKGAHSLVLLAVVNANYEFIMCDFGIDGRISDGGVIEYSQFYRKLKDRKLSIPPPTRIMNSKEALPFVFIAGKPEWITLGLSAYEVDIREAMTMRRQTRLRERVVFPFYGFKTSFVMEVIKERIRLQHNCCGRGSKCEALDHKRQQSCGKPRFIFMLASVEVCAESAEKLYVDINSSVLN
ncbi:unnamed protein product [Acanthoscelides obtectus]|uniref:DDE Tnp4 domain-containing protein n=1 Tax=Acanthoscelides obtectus TaxID=200917 RepID=A0A9P0K4A2_ACAOB|nr:unnamed protein product [Acanthoscelides obtectus]